MQSGTHKCTFDALLLFLCTLVVYILYIVSFSVPFGAVFMTIHSQLLSLAEEVSRLEAKLAKYEQAASVPMREAENLSDVVRSARQEQGLTQKALADLAEVSHVSIVKLEKQGIAPRMDTLLRILAALGLTLYVGGVS